MATAIPSPAPSGAYSDLVTLEEASLLLKPTGHPVTRKTLKRWCLKHGVTVYGRRGSEDWAEWSDILEIHAKEVDARKGR